ncbi:hypothetical protein E4U41_007524 [Claviceps citrina]|nr:hypothetical protein E4U41_007524 [Claviceps citrina]
MVLSRRTFSAIGAAVVVITIFMSLLGRADLRRDVRATSSSLLGHVEHDTLRDVFNATLGFADILVVGLPARTDRRDGMTLAAALSELKITFVDGVKGDEVNEKAVPTPKSRHHLQGASLGSWRGHMNAIQEVVRRNLSSALIMEDDIDWDVRIREQLRDFALSSRALIQPLRGQPGKYADPTYPRPRVVVDDNNDNNDASKKKKQQQQPSDISFHQLPSTVEPSLTPYGDSWDVLWLGHCGMSFPFEDNDRVPKGRVARRDDASVPPKKDLWSINKPFRLLDDYPEHTRVVHHAQEGVCSLAYAVSQRGARRMLRELALKPATDAFDILLRFYCEGSKGRTKQECLAVNPTLFSHHRPVGPIGASSDIGSHGDGYRQTAVTDMIRFSTRLNAEVIMSGGTDYVDQFPDPPPPR